MTTPPSDPFGAPREGDGRPAERPSWDTSGYGAPPQQGPSYGRQPGPWQAGAWQPGQQQPQRYGSGGSSWQGPTATGSQAIVALVCAIASWVVLPVLPAIAALMIARTAREQIARSGGRLTGDGLVTAAKVIAWANLVLVLLGVILVVVGIGLFAAASDTEIS